MLHSIIATGTSCSLYMCRVTDMTTKLINFNLSYSSYEIAFTNLILILFILHGFQYKQEYMYIDPKNVSLIKKFTG